MIKLVYPNSLLFLLVVGLCLAVAGAQPQQTADKQAVAADVGREDPFASLAKKPKPDTSQQAGEQLTAIEEQKPNLFVETVTLKFLNANSLKGAIEKMSSKHGSISTDASSNSLIVCDTNENLPRILAEIRKADKSPEQIMIEVVLLDVQLGDDTEIGVDWDLLSAKNYNFAYRQSMIYPDRLTTRTDALDVGNATNYMTTPLGTLGGELSVISSTVRNVVHLLQETRNVDILASPRVMVVSGQKASIKTTEEIPYQEVTQSTSGGGGASAITSTQFKEVGVTMEVTATVTDNGKIKLEIKPSQSVTTGTSIGGVPVIDTREASTTLLMDDGQVAVMGGLRKQETQIVNYRVPLLGDLPLIGFIFSDDHKEVVNSELLVLLSPHVYKGEPISDEQMTKFNELREKPMLSIPDNSKNFLRLPKSADKKKQSSK